MDRDDLPRAVARERARPSGRGGAAHAADGTEDLDLKNRIRELEARMIREALRRAGGNRAEASRRLGISYPSLLTKIRAYRLSEGE